MFVFRGLRRLTRGCLGLLTVVPLVALVLGVFVERGPAGEARLSFFPMALVALDPFVWTCARNSVIFAGVVTAASLIVGVGLGCLVSRLRFWGRAILRGAVASLLAAPPLVLALGLVGIGGAPQPWPWPIRAVEGGTRGSVSRPGVDCRCGCSGLGRASRRGRAGDARDGCGGRAARAGVGGRGPTRPAPVRFRSGVG